MQSSCDVAPAACRHVPLGHSTHALADVAPSSPPHFPATQERQDPSDDAPAPPPYLPAAQLAQAPSVRRPRTVLHLPAGQGEQTVDPGWLAHLPAAHSVQAAAPAALQRPAWHAAHSSEEFPMEEAPGGQSAAACDAPASTMTTRAPKDIT